MATKRDIATDSQVKQYLKQDAKTLTVHDSKMKHREERQREQRRRRKQTIDEVRRIRPSDIEETDDAKAPPSTRPHDAISSSTEEATEAFSSDSDAMQTQNVDADGFQLVKRKKISKRRVSQAIAPSVPPVLTQNRFDALPEASASLPGTTESSHPVVTEKRPKVPPIVVYQCSNHVKLCRELKTIISGTLRAAYTGDSTKFYVDTYDDYGKVFKFCQDNNLPFHTYQDASHKDKKVVIKDLPPTVDPADVKQDLELKGFQVKEVHQFKRKNEGRFVHLPVYCVTLPRSEKADTIYDVRHVLYTKVRVQDYEMKLEPSQCKKCQRWTHTTNYCWLPARCVRCGDTHSIKDCRHPKEAPPKCANCQQQHTASWKGCPDYQKALKKFRAPTTRSSPPQQKMKQAPTPETPTETTTRSAPPPPPAPPKPPRPAPRRAYATVAQPHQDVQHRPPDLQPSRGDTDAALSEVTSVLKSLSGCNFLNKLIAAGKKMLAATDKLTKIVILVETLAQLDSQV